VSVSDAVVDSSGAVSVVGEAGDNQAFAYSAVRPRGGHFGALSVIDDSDQPHRLALEPDGRLASVFRLDTNNNDGEVQAASYDPRYRAPPRFVVQVRAASVQETRDFGLHLFVAVPQTERVAVRLWVDARRARAVGLGRRARTIASGIVTVRRLHDLERHFRLTGAARRHLRHRHRLFVRLTMTATAAGRRTTKNYQALLSDRSELTGFLPLRV
jgi:hypothetical protein